MSDRQLLVVNIRNVYHVSVPALSVHNIVAARETTNRLVNIHLVGILVRLMKICNLLNMFYNRVRIRFAKSHPSNSTTTASITKVYFVMRVVWFYGRDSQRYFSLIVQTFGGIVKTGLVYRVAVRIHIYNLIVYNEIFIFTYTGSLFAPDKFTVVRLKQFFNTGIFFTHGLPSNFFQFCVKFSCSLVNQPFTKLFILHLLNLNLILTDEVKNLLLGDGLALVLLEPVRQTHPLVFASLQATALLYHLQPLLRCALLLLDTFNSLLCIRHKYALVLVGFRETCAIFANVC